MATDARVKTLFAEELAARAPQQFASAGDNWPKQVMGFFFPENEDTVDLCALAVLDMALQEDQTVVPKKVRKNVALLINTDTKAKSALITISLTTLQPSQQ